MLSGVVDAVDSEDRIAVVAFSIWEIVQKQMNQMC